MASDQAGVSVLCEARGGALDRRRALTISPTKPDSCRTGSPYKIPRRLLSAEVECVQEETDIIQDKIHWTLLAPNGDAHNSGLHNGTSSNHLLASTEVEELDRCRRQVQVILTDVLQTEVGRSYLRQCGCGLQATSQSECSKRRSSQAAPAELRERRDKRTNSLPPKRTDSLQPKLANLLQAKRTDSLQAKRTDSLQAKRTNSQTDSPLLPKRTDSRTDSPEPRQTEPVQSEEPDSRPLKGIDSPEPKGVNSPRFTWIRGVDSLRHTPTRPLTSQRRTSTAESGSEENDRKRESAEESESGEEDKTGEEDERVEEDKSGEEEEEGDEEERGEEERGEERESVCRDEELAECGGGDSGRGSVLRHPGGVVGGAEGDAPPKCHRLQGEHTPDSQSSAHKGQNPAPETGRRGLIRTPSKSCPPEPIVVLSSEEEEEEEEDVVVEEEDVVVEEEEEEVVEEEEEEELQTAMETHSAEDMHTQETETHTQVLQASMMELPFSAFHMGGVRVLANGHIKITNDRISIPVRDSSGAVVTVALATTNLCRYSVWEGLMLRDSGLVEDDGAPPPSVLLLWVSDGQARRLHNQLSIIQPETRPAEGSVCVLLCLREGMLGIEAAMLASMMDILGLRHGVSALLSPLSPTETLQVLAAPPARDTPTLLLLRPHPPDPADSKDPEVRPVYTLSHCSTGGRYAVTMTTTPGAQWTPYRHRGPTRRLIQFPPPPSKGAIAVTTEDLECLDSGEFLNDVIIDFYLKYLIEEKAPRASVERCHVFSSFFYKQLTRRDNAHEDYSSTPAQRRRHQRVRTWTRHVDIFNKDFLFVPVNQEAHWYLVVICFPGLEEAQYEERRSPGRERPVEGDSSGQAQASDETLEAGRLNGDQDRPADESGAKYSPSSDPPDCTEQTCKRLTVCKRPCILVMDSLKLSVHERIFKLLREYLQVEFEVKRGVYRDFSSMVGSHCRVPLQDNSSDCGLYLLQYAESFIQDPVLHFDLPLYLRRWFPRQQVRRKREEIRDLILHLCRFQQGTLGNGGPQGSTVQQESSASWEV